MRSDLHGRKTCKIQLVCGWLFSLHDLEVQSLIAEPSDKLPEDVGIHCCRPVIETFETVFPLLCVQRTTVSCLIQDLCLYKDKWR